MRGCNQSQRQKRHPLHPIFRHYNYENNTIHKTDCRGVDTFPRLPSINEGGL